MGHGRTSAPEVSACPVLVRSTVDFCPWSRRPRQRTLCASSGLVRCDILGVRARKATLTLPAQTKPNYEVTVVAAYSQQCATCTSDADRRGLLIG